MVATLRHEIPPLIGLAKQVGRRLLNVCGDHRAPLKKTRSSGGTIKEQATGMCRVMLAVLRR